MKHKVKKVSVSYYPNPQINCVVLLFLNGADTAVEENAIYSVPMPVALNELNGLTTEEKNSELLTRGLELFQSSSVQAICADIEANQDLITPELL